LQAKGSEPERAAPSAKRSGGSFRRCGVEGAEMAPDDRQTCRRQGCKSPYAPPERKRPPLGGLFLSGGTLCFLRKRDTAPGANPKDKKARFRVLFILFRDFPR